MQNEKLEGFCRLAAECLLRPLRHWRHVRVQSILKSNVEAPANQPLGTYKKCLG